MFGGAAEDGESLARGLAATQKAIVYLLDFDDEAESVQELKGTSAKRLRQHPAEFLADHGIVAPGFEDESSAIVTAAVVEKVTPEQARKAFRNDDASYLPHPRGILIGGEAASAAAVALSLRLEARAYIMYLERDAGTFSVVIHEPGQPEREFSSGPPSPNYTPVEWILGETSFEGILRVLGIPRDLLEGE